MGVDWYGGPVERSPTMVSGAESRGTLLPPDRRDERPRGGRSETLTSRARTAAMSYATARAGLLDPAEVARWRDEPGA
jgi:hypothetical protein